MNLRKQRQQQRYDAVLAAAAALFSEKGYAGATVGEIAQRAGVAKGTPYLYFADKVDLLYAVFEHFAGDHLQHAQAALAQAGSAREKLRAMALGTVDYLESHREWFPLSMEIWTASNTPELRQRFGTALQKMYALYRGATVTIIRKGQADGEIRASVDADALATVLVGAMDGLFLQCWFDAGLNSRELVEHFLDILDNGLIPVNMHDGKKEVPYE